MSTLSNIRSNIRTTYLKIDPNAKVWDNNTLDYFANKWYDKLQEDFGYELPECQQSTTISTTTTTNEYDKPSDFVRLTGIFYNSQTLSPITKQDYLRNRASNSLPSSYYIYGSKIGLYPNPDWVYTIDLLYNGKLPELTDTQDSLLANDMEDLIVLYACYLMFLSVEKKDKATMCLGQYGSKKDWLYAKTVYNDENITFWIWRSWSWYRDNVI